MKPVVTASTARAQVRETCRSGTRGPSPAPQQDTGSAGAPEGAGGDREAGNVKRSATPGQPDEGAPREWPCQAWLKHEGRPCGAPQHPVYKDRCARGHTDMRALGARTMFKPANWEGLQHSMRTERWPPGLEVLRDEVASFMAGCLADEGDVADVPTRRLSLLSHRARIERRIIQIDARLEQAGLTDKRGKLRVAWLQQLQSLINTAKALDQLLGLERKQKRVKPLMEVLSGG